MASKRRQAAVRAPTPADALFAVAPGEAMRDALGGDTHAMAALAQTSRGARATMMHGGGALGARLCCRTPPTPRELRRMVELDIAAPIVADVDRVARLFAVDPLAAPPNGFWWLDTRLVQDDDRQLALVGDVRLGVDRGGAAARMTVGGVMWVVSMRESAVYARFAYDEAAGDAADTGAPAAIAASFATVLRLLYADVVDGDAARLAVLVDGESGMPRAFTPGAATGDGDFATPDAQLMPAPADKEQRDAFGLWFPAHVYDAVLRRRATAVPQCAVALDGGGSTTIAVCALQLGLASAYRLHQAAGDAVDASQLRDANDQEPSGTTLDDIREHAFRSLAAFIAHKLYA